MQAGSQRHERLQSQMQRVVAELLARGLKDPRIGRVSITAVSLSPDLGHARVFFLPFGGSGEVAALSEGLNSAAGYLRGEVARALSLRHAPKLEFVLDTHLVKADALSRLIDSAVARDSSVTQDSARAKDRRSDS